MTLLTGEIGPSIDAVVLDLVMPDLDGLGVLARLREAGIALPVIVQTAHGGIDNVVSVMRAGATDFVVKPVSPERLQVSLRNALVASALQGELARIKHSRTGTLTFRDIVTRSPRMQAVLRTAGKAATSAIPVLIAGPSGVGKELIARAIHGSGERRAKPFVAVNCGAIPDNLVESILFGHEKGAFTGATDRHTGKFVEASGGTLFLDEVGELPPAAQVKLLRAIQEGEVEPVGGAQARQGGRADHLRHQPRSRRRRDGGPLPRGSVLPPARLSDRGAGAGRAAGGYRGAGAPFPRPLRGRGRQAHPHDQRRGAGAADRLSLARQCPPARERGVPRGGAGRGRRGRGQRIPADCNAAGTPPLGRRRRGRPDRAAGRTLRGRPFRLRRTIRPGWAAPLRLTGCRPPRSS